MVSSVLQIRDLERGNRFLIPLPQIRFNTKSWQMTPSTKNKLSSWPKSSKVQISWPLICSARVNASVILTSAKSKFLLQPRKPHITICEVYIKITSGSFYDIYYATAPLQKQLWNPDFLPVLKAKAKTKAMKMYPRCDSSCPKPARAPTWTSSEVIATEANVNTLVSELVTIAIALS